MADSTGLGYRGGAIVFAPRWNLDLASSANVASNPLKAAIAEWRRAYREHAELSLLLIDIDDFKAYNDGYGHLAGDDCLKRIAGAWNRATSRPGDLFARYGGEEFAVLLPRTNAARALRCAEQLQDALAALALPHRFARASELITASMGVATLTPDVRIRPSDFIRRADRALYVAKAEGRNRVVLATDTP